MVFRMVCGGGTEKIHVGYQGGEVNSNNSEKKKLKMTIPPPQSV